MHHRVFKRNQQLDLTMQILEISIVYIPRNSQILGIFFCKSKRNGRCTSHVLPRLVQLIMLFVFEINLVMKLFVLVKIPCEVGMHCNFTDGKQESAETKLQKKSLITQPLSYEDGTCWCCIWIYIWNTLPVSYTCINHSMQILLNTYIFLYVTATNKYT